MNHDIDLIHCGFGVPVPTKFRLKDLQTAPSLPHPIFELSKKIFFLVLAGAVVVRYPNPLAFSSQSIIGVSCLGHP